MPITYTPTAEKNLAALPRDVQDRIMKKMRHYDAQANPLDFAEPLVGFDAYRFRIGAYRVVCKVISGTIVVLLVKKRDSAYDYLS